MQSVRDCMSILCHCVLSHEQSADKIYNLCSYPVKDNSYFAFSSLLPVDGDAVWMVPHHLGGLGLPKNTVKRKKALDINPVGPILYSRLLINLDPQKSGMEWNAWPISMVLRPAAASESLLETWNCRPA